MLKKFFSVVIVILILTTMVPISTLAADSDNDYLRGCSISFENEKFWSSEWGEYVDEVEKIIDTTIDLEMPNYFTQCELTPHPSDRDNASYKIYSSGTLVSNNTPYTVDMPSPDTLAFRVEVTAQNGQTRDYTVNITRAAVDNEGEAFNITLSGDTNSEGSYDIEFLSYRYQYDINVDNKQTVANFDVYPMDELTTYNIYCNGLMIANNESKTADLLVGTNVIEVVLASQTSKQKTYTFLIHRDDSDSLLDIDSLSAYSYMTPFYSDESSRHNHLEPFDKHNVNQSFIVPNSIQSITYGVYPSSDATVVVKKGEYTVSYVEGLGYQSNLDAGVNTFTFEVSHPDMSFTKMYTVTVTREAQNNINADLGNLRIFGSPVVGFDSNTITYDYYNRDSSSLTVTPIVKDSSATYQVLKDGALVGSNSETNVSLNASPLPTVITVVVTAGNGTTTKTYTVNVKRVSSIAVLESLSLNNNNSQNDYPVTIQNGIYTYSVDTAYIDDTVYMSADFNRFKENSELVVYDSADQVLWDSSLGGDLWKTDLALNVGLNTYRLEVTAEDGVTKNNYTININRAAAPEADNADINNVTLWLNDREVDFFTPNDYDYEFSVDNKIYPIELHYTLKNSNATSSVYLNGNLVAQYAAGAPGVGLNNLPLNEGSNTLSVEVVAQDSVTTNTYTFNINRAVSALQYIDIVKIPDKVDYVIGDTLDITGLSVRSNYESGYFEMLGKDDVSVSGFDSQTTGSQTITITYQSKTATFDVNVTNGGATQPVTGVSLDKSITSVAVGGTGTLTATVSPTDATNKNMTWSSDDVNVATVTDGVVTGVAAGTATITVETVDGEFTDTCLVNVSEVTGFVQGNGTPGDPYGISTPAQLNEVRNYLDSHFILLNDIDLDAATSEGGDYYNDGAGWMPIGDSLNPFEGVFDGDGYEITGLNIDLTTTVSEIYIGLFGYVQGTIKNINVDTGSINVSTTGEAYVGSIAGYAVNGNILNCIIDDVNLDVLGDYVCTGGITGYAENTTLEDCGFKGNITANASGYKSRVGGIVGLGLNGVRILTSYNTGSVFAEGRGAFVGGIAGFIKRTDSISIQYISKCYNTGDICANCTDTTARIAGIAGYASYTEITNCFNTGQISKQSTYIATLGGIVGYTSYPTISSPISLYDCYNVGEIIGGGYVGAIAGGSAAGIDDCYYADTCSVGIGSGTGTTYQKTLEQMKKQATYNGFNFSSIWEISNHVYYEYPTLQGASTYPLQGDTVMFDGGFGTKTKPFLVSTPEHLNNVRHYPDAHFIILNDIDMSAATSEGGVYWNDGAGWEPIQSFSGVFDGGGYIISNLFILSDKSQTGLFGIAFSATIKNLNIIDANVTGVSDSGIIAGSLNGEISNCTVSGRVVGSSYTGGIVGEMTGDISYCTNMARVSSNGFAGGITGKVKGDILYCSNHGDIIGIGIRPIGGIVGETWGLVQDCYNTGDLYQTDPEQDSGGIAGWHYSYVGDYTYVNCYNIGYATYGITACNWLNTTDWLNCYYLEAMAEKWEDYGYPITTSELENILTYEGYDFAEVWTMDGELTYPYAELQNAVQPPVMVINTYDLSDFGNDSVIYLGTVETGKEVILTNNTGETYSNVRVICLEGVTLTLNNVKINNSFNSKNCPLSFSGSGNYLRLEGNSYLEGGDVPGIMVENGTTLEISGLGELEAKGNSGIGARDSLSAGKITIKSGTITATGRWEGAGIGGGKNGSGGQIIISGGIITATGGPNGGSGIGSGHVKNADGIVDGGEITIEGGEITAKGGYNAAGIGGGSAGNGGVINIFDGTIEAIGSMDGAGIGGGSGGSAGDITISGGKIYAKRGNDEAFYDIGYGAHRNGGTVTISGNAIVFLYAGNCVQPQTTTHDLFSSSNIVNHKAFGLDIPDTWETRTYAYLNTSNVFDLEYNMNTGVGSVPQTVTQYKDTTVTVASGDQLNKDGLPFVVWNTSGEGTGDSYNPGDTFIFGGDVILYAIYEEPIHTESVSLSSSREDLHVGESIKLTAVITPEDATNQNVTWISDNEGIVIVDSNGSVSAVATGTATITVTTEDGSFTDTCDVTVTQPVTGISLEWSTLTVYAGTESMPLISTVYPANASNKNLIWSSSNNSVATVVGGLVNPLSSGTTIITVTTEDGGFTDTCVVTVKERKIESSVYSIDSTYISGIAVNTSVTQLKANLLNDSLHIKIFDTKGAEYTGSAVATGMKVKFYLEGDLADELTIIILGDANGDGKISITDYTLARLDILGLKDLGQTAATAADINGDGKVSITDYTLMRLDILGLKSIH